MSKDLQAWIGGLALGCIVFCTGCAGGPSRSGSSWMNLPSPWTTVKNSTAKPKSAEGSRTERIASTRSEPTAKTVAVAAKQPAKAPSDKKKEESLTMTLLRGRNCERSGDWDKARQIYEELLKDHPDNVEVAHRLGVVADAQKRHLEAEQLFLFGLQREPRNAALLSDLGYCYFLQGQLSKAEIAILKATVLEPKNPLHWNNLGLVVGHMGRHQEALEDFRKAGSEADAQYNLAFVYAAQNREDQAKVCFQTALVSDPAHRRSREALASFEEYDRLPQHMKEIEDVADSRVRYVPYIEGTDPTAANSGVVPAAVQESASTSYNSSRSTRALFNESRGMLNRNMASQRADETAGQ